MCHLKSVITSIVANNMGSATRRGGLNITPMGVAWNKNDSNMGSATGGGACPPMCF